MNSLSPEVIVVIAVVVVAAFSFFGRRRKPKERTFKCGRCSTVSAHTPRTIEAWRAGKTKFFCNACHGQWLRSHPAPTQSGRGVTSGRAGNSGCLGVIVLFIVLPVFLASAWWAYA
jgi:hypothetical protein